MKSRDQKINEAKTRQNEYAQLSTLEKIQRLDEKFGKGKGAKKERLKLQRLLEAGY